MKAFLILLVMAFVATPLLAKSQRDSAREITSRPEYKDYKIVRSPGDSSSQTGDSSSGDGGDGGSDHVDSSSRRRAEGRDDAPQRRSGGGGAPMDLGWFGVVITYFMWGVFIAGIALALYFIIKALINMKWRGRKKAKKAKTSAKQTTQSTEANVDEPAYEEMAPIFRDALDLALEDFEKAVSAKEWDRATLLAYRIFWIKAGWRGCVEDQDVRTWRDAIRMVQTREHRTDVKRLLPLVEYIRYGEHVPSETEFKSWYQQLKTLPTRGILA